MASGVARGSTASGAFTEIVEKTGGGLLVTPGRPIGAGRRPAAGRTRALATTLGARGVEGVAALQHRPFRGSVARAIQLDVADCGRRWRIHEPVVQ
jgi:hypothetical protein